MEMQATIPSDWLQFSSWQGWLRHLPRRSEYQQPGYGVNNFTRFFSTLSWRSPKAAFGYFKNGHTALVARIQGRVHHIVGFNPNFFTKPAAPIMLKCSPGGSAITKTRPTTGKVR